MDLDVLVRGYETGNFWIKLYSDVKYGYYKVDQEYEFDIISMIESSIIRLNRNKKLEATVETCKKKP